MNSNTTIVYKLNNQSVTLTNSVISGGNDGVIKLAEGINKLELECKLSGDTDGSTKKIYTLYINRVANCSAAMTYSDFMSVVGNTGNVNSDRISVSYPKDKKVFNLSVTAAITGRTVTIKQSGKQKATGTTSAQADGLSLFEEVNTRLSSERILTAATCTIMWSSTPCPLWTDISTGTTLRITLSR